MPGAEPRGRARALVEAAEATLQTGRLADSRAGFAEAAAAATAEGDGEALARAALGIGGLWVYEQRDFVERATLDALWRRARAEAAPGSLVAARLDVRTAAEAVYEGGPVAAVERAAAAVLAFGDDRASAEALSLLHHVQLDPSRARSRLHLAEEVVRLAARAGDPLLSLMGLCWRTVDLFQVGDHRAERSLQELHERAEAAPCEALAFVADVMAAMRLARNGRLAEAEAAAGAAFERGVGAGDPDAAAYFGAMLASLRWWQGRPAEIVDEVRAVTASPRLGPNDHVYVAADAALSAAMGDVEAAEEAIARLTGIGLRALPESSSWLTTQLLLAEAAFLIGDARTAAEVAELVEPFAELPVLPSVAVVCLGSARRPLGLAAATAGDLDAAVAHLEEAVRADRRLGSRPMAAFTEHTLAAVLAVRGGAGDAVRALELRARATAAAERMGMVLPDPPAWLTSTAAGPRTARLRHLPSGWCVEVEGRMTPVGELVGVGYLAVLVAAPGEDHDVLRLTTSVPGARPGRDPVLDRRALESYRARARELAARLAAGGLDPDGVAELREELDAIADAVRAATGRRGRARDFPTDHERARTAVRKALVRAVEAIAAAEPALAEHLRASLTTGAMCRYDPAAAWDVRSVLD